MMLGDRAKDTSPRRGSITSVTDPPPQALIAQTRPHQRAGVSLRERGDTSFQERETMNRPHRSRRGAINAMTAPPQSSEIT